MTLSQLTETLFGKVCSLKGQMGDSTAFTSSSIDPTKKIMEELKDLGFERHGNEKMYSGYTGEMLEAEVFIGPTYYQRLKHLVKDKMHCLTLDHQVLTRNGWKNIYEITLEDKVATLNKKGELEYQEPTHVWKYENYDGMMYHIKNQAIDLSVTANHRMWVCKNEYGINNYDFENAQDIVGKVRRYKSDAIWNGEDDLLLSKEKSKDLIDSMIKHTPITLSQKIADKIQHLCLHAGYSCIMNKLNENEYEVFINKFTHNPLANVDEKEDLFVHEVCDVMCITVPNEVFYVRRNGKAVWTGNSRSRGNVTMMHHQPSEGRSRDGGLRTGEMERDSLIAHGGAAFIQETFFDMSDVYQVNVCNICGNIISTAKQCRVCKKDDITKTNIPYCTKLLFQELQALGVKINISTKP